MSLRRGASTIANSLLRPFDVEVRRRFSGGPRRVTITGDLESIIERLERAEFIVAAAGEAAGQCWFRQVFSHAPLVDATMQERAARGFRVEDFTELAYGPDGDLRKADCLFVREGSDLARQLAR